MTTIDKFTDESIKFQHHVRKWNTEVLPCMFVNNAMSKSSKPTRLVMRFPGATIHGNWKGQYDTGDSRSTRITWVASSPEGAAIKLFLDTVVRLTNALPKADKETLGLIYTEKAKGGKKQPPEVFEYTLPEPYDIDEDKDELNIFTTFLTKPMVKAEFTIPAAKFFDVAKTGYRPIDPVAYERSDMDAIVEVGAEVMGKKGNHHVKVKLFTACVYNIKPRGDINDELIRLAQNLSTKTSFVDEPLTAPNIDAMPSALDDSGDDDDNPAFEGKIYS